MWDPNALGNNTQQELDAGMLKLRFAWNVEKFESKLGNLANIVIPHMGVFMEEIAKKAFAKVISSTPKEKKGHTSIRDLWQMLYTRGETIQEYVINNLYPQGEVLWWMEEGTRPHIIKAKPGGWLRWEDEDTGEEVFAKIVRHPGTKAHHMVRKAKEIAEPLIEEYIEKTFEQVRSMGSY